MRSVVTCLQQTHDIRLLLFAAAICFIGIYGSFSIAQHAGRSEGLHRKRWASVSILTAACTAWATHMVALLAFQPGMQSGFEPILTASSLLLAVVGIGAGMMITVGRQGRARRLAGGIVIGMGVALLHYVGQAAYVVRGVVHWDEALVILSIVASLPIFGLSLLTAGERNRMVRSAAAPLLFLGIAVLHLTGMLAMQIEFDPHIQLPPLTISADILAPIVAGLCFALGAIAVAGLRLTLMAKAALQRERKRLGELANLALEGLAVCEDGMIVSANESLARLCDMRPDELAGKPLATILPSLDISQLPEREEAGAEVLSSTGKRLPVRVLSSAVRLGGRPQTVIAFRDQRERLRSEERIRALAFSDPLTGLANRSCFHDALAEAVAANGEQGTPFTLLLLDLDGFKSVNDAFGHASGDEVLRIVGERIRSIAAEKDVVARLGGDEFTILILGSADPLSASELGRRVIAEIEKPIQVHQQVAHISASIGIMLSQPEPIGSDEVLTAADLALYDAKANGKARFRLFTPELRRAAVARSGVANELQDAWDEEHFELYYQPQVDLSTSRVIGAEALIRWNYPYCGVLAPSAFLSVLETSHLSVPVGEWIIRTACRQAMEWRLAGLKNFRIGVNLFASQFRLPDFVDRVEAAMAETGLPPNGLELEITENIVLRNDRIIAGHLKRLRAMGVGIAFDDFGTGFASLTMLKELDITRLKIDRSFIRDIETSRKDQGIVDAVIRMAAGCDLAVIAEGIETEAQAEYLRGKVSEAQGYLFGKPMQASLFEQTFVSQLRSVA